jgi:hypothetical protein
MLSLYTTDVKHSPNTRSALGRQMDAKIRRMIVIMMDANHISERLSSLKNERSDLRVANALYCNRKGYTALEKTASALRRERLVEIKLELTDLMKRCA